MKEIDGWVKIKKYTDDDGKPVCGGCVMLRDSGDRYECDFEGVGIYPGPLCPVWHGESKSEYKWADADELLAVELVGVNLGIVSDDIADAIKKVAVEAFNAARERKEM